VVLPERSSAADASTIGGAQRIEMFLWPFETFCPVVLGIFLFNAF